MKKITLFLVAMTMSLLSFAAQPKRIYAYDLSSALVDKVYTFSFTANETPTSGKIIFYDATSSELVGEIALTNPVLGKNEVEIAEYSLPGNDGQQLNWAVELSAAAVTAYEKIFADASHQYRRGFSNVDISPESDYFGTVYVADWCKTKTNSKIYVYNPVYSKSATGYNPGSPSAGWGCSRFTIAPNGNLWLTDYSDGHSGLFLVDPADLTKATQFFAGTRESSGLIKNGNVEVGSSLSCATLYGTGANTKLVTVAEDYTGKSFPVAVFNVGQEDGSLATSWTTAPNILFNTLGNAAQSFDVKACEKGVWVATNRTTGQNTSGATSLRFYTWDGICTWSSHEHIDIINGNLGGGIAITPDEKQIVMKIHDNNIAVFDITWNEDTPTLTTNATFNCGYAAVSAINLDYAGNIVTVAGTHFGSTDTQRMSLVVYSNPTNDNTCEVPAKKSSVVTKVAASATLYTVVTNVNDVVMGVVTGNAGTYEEGATATLTAEPTTGYQFVNWTVGEDTYTANPLEIVVNSNLTITANFKAISYTITANVNKEQYGNVTGGGAYDYNTTATLTATANDGYEFVNWSNGSTDNPLAYTVTKDETITANFRQVLASSITLNALPVQDYSATIVGTLKRALQNGENTIVLTHEANGTPHIYNVAHATNTVTEISQEGVVAVDSENAGDYLAISDIALTEDGKLVATNKIVCQSEDGQVAAGYKRGELRAYIWNDLAGAPSLWFTSKQSSNWYRSIQGHTIAYKGTSTNGTLFATGVTASGVKFRYSVYNVIDGVYTDPSSNNSDYYHFTKGSAQTTDALGANYQLVASPLASPNWILDGELVEPFEIVDPLTFNTEVTANPTLSVNLGKKYNGASCLANYNDHHLMIAPYAGADGKLAGVKVLGITDGFANPTIVEANGNLANAIDATTAAATAYVDVDGDLTIYLIADGKVYTFSEKVPDFVIYNVTATAGEGGTVEGGGIYEEGTTATLTATPAEHYDFLNWTYGSETSTANPLTVTVNSDMTVTANFQEHAKYTITASAANNTMGYVTGSGTYYVGESVTLKATAKTGYYFTGWSDSNTDNPRTFTATEDVTLQANFAVAYPRVYAYDLDIVDNGDSYTFSFKPNTDAVSGNLLLYSEDGTTVVQTYAISTPILAHTATSVTLNKTDLPTQADIPWAIQLSGNDIPAFAETFADADYRFARAHAVVDNSPESEYFGRVYVADRRKTKSNSSVYVYNPDFTDLTTTKLGLTTAGYSRPAVGADGTLYLTGYTDGDEAGIFVVDPADLTKCTQFFNGTNDSDGLYKNNGKEIGSSTSGVGVYGSGKDAVLYTMMEDGSNANFNSGKQPIVKYQIGQENGTVLKQWSDEPTWLVNYPATGKDSYNFGNNDFAATAKGVWVSQNKSNPADRPEIAFVDKTGTIQFMQNSKPSLGGGMTVNADNTALYIVEDSKILEYAITWNENTPSLTLSNTYPISLQYISTLSVDYAGNLIACAGTTYGTTDNNVMKVVCFTLPTNDNTCTTPAPKSKAIKKVLLYDTQNNEEILSNLNDSQTETVFVFRNLTGGMYNTLCLPFDVDDLTGTPLENATVWQYNGATVKGDGTSKEIFLDFAEVTSITAGKPYLVEPAEDITAPMEFKNVTISVTNGNNVAQGAVTMHGILHPTELQANNKSILFLVENNNLAWANETANMNGMRAYFKVNEPSLLSARTRAYIRKEPTVATDMENITTSETEIKKVIYNGTLYIIRGDEVYTIQGTKVK